MGFEETNNSLAALNNRLDAFYKKGDPATLIVNARPQLHIMSFSPIVYEKYGHIRNRAPIVCGTLALREFLTQPHPDGGAVVYGAAQAESTGYGFRISDVNVINRTAIYLGFPENAFEYQ